MKQEEGMLDADKSSNSSDSDPVSDNVVSDSGESVENAAACILLAEGVDSKQSKAEPSEQSVEATPKRSTGESTEPGEKSESEESAREESSESGTEEAATEKVAEFGTKESAREESSESGAEKAASGEKSESVTEEESGTEKTEPGETSESVTEEAEESGTEKTVTEKATIEEWKESSREVDIVSQDKGMYTGMLADYLTDQGIEETSEVTVCFEVIHQDLVQIHTDLQLIATYGTGFVVLAMLLLVYRLFRIFF